MSWVGGCVVDTLLVLARDNCIVSICILFPGTSTLFSNFKMRCFIVFSLSIRGFLYTCSYLCVLFFVFGSESDLESMHFVEGASLCRYKNAEGSLHLVEVAMRSGLDLFLRF